MYEDQYPKVKPVVDGLAQDVQDMISQFPQGSVKYGVEPDQSNNQTGYVDCLQRGDQVGSVYFIYRVFTDETVFPRSQRRQWVEDVAELWGTHQGWSVEPEEKGRNINDLSSAHSIYSRVVDKTGGEGLFLLTVGIG